MSDNRTTIQTIDGIARGGGRAPTEELGIVIAWSRDEPGRAGEIAFIEGEQILGRGGPRAEDGARRVAFHRQRPGAFTKAGPIDNLHISRVQLRLRASSGALRVESVGRRHLLVNGARVASAAASPGDTLQIEDQLVLVVVQRAREMPAAADPELATFPFGGPDRHGLVGESPAAWRLRDAMLFAARSDEHILVTGESGTGKELVARAIHAISSRGGRPLISRNAATIPEGIVDAELFGNVKNYPNPGTPEREGLCGEADGSTLFLDEIGELPVHLQAHLLRVIDSRGEYQRLGEARPRRTDLRLVAATNRAASALKHDFAARLTLRLEIPPLDRRREDIPLLARHLLREIAAANDHVARRFFEPAKGGGGLGEPRIEAALVDALVRRSYGAHTRELRRLLWQAIAESPGDRIALPAKMEGEAEPVSSAPPPPAGEASPTHTREEIEASLARNGGNVTLAARELGFKNRYALYRDMKRVGMSRKPDE